MVLMSKLLLIFLNLDVQLKDFSDCFYETGFSFVKLFPIENSISFLLCIQTQHLILLLLTEW